MLGLVSIGIDDLLWAAKLLSM